MSFHGTLFSIVTVLFIVAIRLYLAYASRNNDSVQLAISNATTVGGTTQGQEGHQLPPSWLLNVPEGSMSSFSSANSRHGRIVDKSLQREVYSSLVTKKTLSFTNGEIRDVVEHFFWGVQAGLVLEVGASVGSHETGSMTYPLEEKIGWKRILIDGDLRIQKHLQKANTKAVVIGAAICHQIASNAIIHYSKEHHHRSGIVEFMSIPFLKMHHPFLLNSSHPWGNMSSIDWTIGIHHNPFELLPCLELRTVFHYLNIVHVNFMLLSTQGAELNVLESIDWTKTSFDVLCICTDVLLRPANYTMRISDYLHSKDYELVAAQIGKNSWFKRRAFQPLTKPGLDILTCWNGARRFHHTESCPSLILT